MTNATSRWGGFSRNLRCLWVTGLLLWVVFCLAYLALPDASVGLTAADADADYVAICAIQGSGDVSPYLGQIVRTNGIVYADFETLPPRGFFLQHADCDGEEGSSDGIFVYLADGSDSVSSGDYVEVSGTVQEYYAQTEIVASMSGIAVISSGHPLPTPIDLDIPLGDQSSASYVESLEGMHVRMAQARVTGPTNSSNETWVVNANLGIERVFADDPGSIGGIVCVDDQGLYEITPKAKVTDMIEGLQGALEVTDGVSRLHLLVPPVLSPSDLPPESGVQPVDQGITVASFNLANLFDWVDDLTTDDTVLTPDEIQRRLRKRALAIRDILAKPDILVVQEVENQLVLQALANRPEIAGEYLIILEDGPDQRGLDIALIYRHDRVTLLEYEVKQGCTDLIDGLGPDGNGDVGNPANNMTCDTDGDGSLDGNRLFSRPPLVVKLRVVSDKLYKTIPQQTVDLTVIANHWKSKLEDTVRANIHCRAGCSRRSSWLHWRKLSAAKLIAII